LFDAGEILIGYVLTVKKSLPEWQTCSKKWFWHKFGDFSQEGIEKEKGLRNARRCRKTAKAESHPTKEALA